MVPVLAGSVALVTISVVACGRVSDASTVDPGPAFSGVPRADAGASACRLCQATACATVEQACAADLDCARFQACRDACPLDEAGAPTAACADACATDNASVRAVQDCTASTRCEACLPPFDAGFVDAQSCQQGYNAVGASQTGPCNECFGSRCCTEMERCVDMPCQEALACIAGCVADGGAASCYETCAAAEPEEMRNLAPADACRLTFCKEVCANGRATCEACSNVRCASEARKLLANTEASLWVLCTTACADFACYATCSNAHASGVADAVSFSNCRLERCANECPQ